MPKRNADKELGAVAAFVNAVDAAIVDWVRGDKLRVDGILKTREALRGVCQGYIPRLDGDDYADHADGLYADDGANEE